MAKATKTTATVATLWIGPALRWTEQLCLTSFLDQGHRVKLYAYDPVGGVPEGVEIADANAVWKQPEGLLAASSPALIADIFRMHLMRETDEFWVDADMIAIRPFVANADGYALGIHNAKKEVNNAVMRIPAGSAALANLIRSTEDPDFVALWMRQIHRDAIAAAPPQDRLALAHQLRRAAFGPMALTHMLVAAGERDQAYPRPVYCPVPWPFTDVLFSPKGGTEGWLTPNTQGIHLWSALLRRFHKNNKPHHNSYVGKLAVKYQIDTKGLRG